MHKHRNFFLIAFITFWFGVMLFLYQQEILLIRMNIFAGSTYTATIQSMQKKIVCIHFWKHEKWQNESCELLWPEDTTDALQALIAHWLVVCEEEGLVQKKIMVQLTSITTSHQALVSFDRNFFAKEQSTFEKLMIIEGLLKTIRENGIKIQALQFLVNHKPLSDYHLDFSRAWPLSGFIEKSKNYS